MCLLSGLRVLGEVTVRMRLERHEHVASGCMEAQHNQLHIQGNFIEHARRTNLDNQIRDYCYLLLTMQHLSRRSLREFTYQVCALVAALIMVAQSNRGLISVGSHQDMIMKDIV